jgi:hypothetical protein
MSREERKQWLEWVLLTSIPIRRYDHDDSPVGTASACLINYRGRRFVLTVAHAVEMGSSDWAIELGFDPRKGTEIYRPSTFLYLGELKRGTGEVTEVDYCYAEVPLDIEPVYQHVTPRGPQSEKQARHIFNQSDLADPSTNEFYAFAGEVNAERHGTHALVTQPTVYPGLRYRRSESAFHEFTLPVPHPGHDSFRGCSGAPIVDTQRRVVALVTGGDDAENIIYGISVARYRSWRYTHLPVARAAAPLDTPPGS